MTTVTSLRAAAKLCGFSPAIIARWCHEFHLGELHAGVFHINQERLLAVAKIKKDADTALDKYRSL